jgi:hypothetical protein
MFLEVGSETAAIAAQEPDRRRRLSGRFLGSRAEMSAWRESLAEIPSSEGVTRTVLAGLGVNAAGRVWLQQSGPITALLQ